jgi:Na+-transporting methylmalonyl-CoA/oxaloacetate decarboxylase gamma subunit
MFYDLDFTEWQSWVILLLVLSTLGLGIVASIYSLFIIHWWMMGDIITQRRRLRK